MREARLAGIASPATATSIIVRAVATTTPGSDAVDPNATQNQGQGRKEREEEAIPRFTLFSHEVSLAFSVRVSSTCVIKAK